MLLSNFIEKKYLTLWGAAREIAQWLKCLPCKCEDLSSNPVHTCNPNTKKMETVDPWSSITRQPSHIIKIQVQRGRIITEDNRVYHQPPYAYAHIYMYTGTWTYTHMSPYIHTYIPLHTHTCMHMCIHAYTHIDCRKKVWLFSTNVDHQLRKSPWCTT